MESENNKDQLYIVATLESDTTPNDFVFTVLLLLLLLLFV